jgi:hypothetical protein
MTAITGSGHHRRARGSAATTRSTAGTSPRPTTRRDRATRQAVRRRRPRAGPLTWDPTPSAGVAAGHCRSWGQATEASAAPPRCGRRRPRQRWARWPCRRIRVRSRFPTRCASQVAAGIVVVAHRPPRLVATHGQGSMHRVDDRGIQARLTQLIGRAAPDDLGGLVQRNLRRTGPQRGQVVGGAERRKGLRHRPTGSRRG